MRAEEVDSEFARGDDRRDVDAAARGRSGWKVGLGRVWNEVRIEWLASAIERAIVWEVRR